MGGVLGTYFLSNGFAVKSGFLYDRRGFKIKMKLYDTSPRVSGIVESDNYTDDYLNVKEKCTISALTIPFYGQYEIDNKLKILFYAGPYISIPLNTKVSVEDVSIESEYSGRTDTDIERISVDIENPNVDFGFSVGTGLIIPMNDTLNFICDLSYKIGIDKLSMEDGRLYDLGASVGLRYRF